LVLILFTATYPYDAGAEQTFLDVELQHLRKNFDRIILAPRKRQGALLPLSDGIEVDESYAAYLADIPFFSALGKTIFSPFFYQEIFALPWLLRYPSAMKRLLAFLAGAQMTRAWVEKWIARSGLDPAECVFYTYWFDQAAYGIGLAKRMYPALNLISRVHGYDLYEEYYYCPAYWPRRRAALSLLDRIFPDSQAGLVYLNSRYPEYSSVYELSLLGVPDPGFQTRASADGVFRIVSCSMLEPVKRIDLLIKGIASAARNKPEQKIEWRHFGNGERRSELQDLASVTFPTNAKGMLPGYTNKEDLMKYYAQNPVDVFINVSASEGTPVAVMEAVSCGIPVIATSVGGNVEIVSEKNGILLDADPTPEQIGKALLAFPEDRSMALSKRKGSHEIWREKYNADLNFQNFAQRLQKITKG